MTLKKNILKLLLMTKFLYFLLFLVLFISCEKSKSSISSLDAKIKNEVKLDTTIYPYELINLGIEPHIKELSNELVEYGKKTHPYWPKWYLIENDFDNDGKKDRVYLIKGLRENGVEDKYFLLYFKKKRVGYENSVQIDWFSKPGIVELKNGALSVNFGNNENERYGCKDGKWEKVPIPINNYISQDAGQFFQGQKIKNNEKIIKINWGKEIRVNYTRDMSYQGSRYASKSYKVPTGKKWILLYINEDFTFEEDGLVLGSIPNLFIDNKEQKFYGRQFSHSNNINLSRAKDENFKYYSGSVIKAVSSRTNGKGMGNNFVDYLGEIWFLEINE